MQSPLQRHTQPLPKASLFFPACFLILLLFTGSVMGATGTDVGTINILERLDPSQNGIISYLFRQIGWGLVTFLRYLVNGIESAIYGITGALGGFYESTGVKNFISGKLLPLAVAMLSLVVVFIGIQYIIKPRDTHTIVTNLITGIIVAVALPAFLSSGFQLTQAAANALGEGKAGSVANQTVLDNTVDLLLYDGTHFSPGKLPYNSFYAKNKDANGLMRISPVELVDPADTQHPEVWSSTVQTGSSGQKTLKPIENGLVSSSVPVLTNGYYRWQVDWLTMLVSLSVSAFALLFTSIRIAKILFELAVQQALAQVLGLLDVYSNQRLKKCLQSILGSLVTFFGCFAMLQLYLIGMQYSSGIGNLFVKLVCMLALALLLINGPSVFEQLFGQNLGGQKGNFVSTIFGLQAMMGLSAAAKRGVFGTVGPDRKRHGGVVPAASNVLSGGAVAAGVGIGAAAGAVSSWKEAKAIKAARDTASPPGNGGNPKHHSLPNYDSGVSEKMVPPSAPTTSPGDHTPLKDEEAAIPGTPENSNHHEIPSSNAVSASQINTAAASHFPPANGSSPSIPEGQALVSSGDHAPLNDGEIVPGTPENSSHHDIPSSNAVSASQTNTAAASPFLSANGSSPSVPEGHASMNDGETVPGTPENSNHHEIPSSNAVSASQTNTAAESPFLPASGGRTSVPEGQTIGRLITSEVRTRIEGSRPVQAARRSYILSYNTAGKIAAKQMDVQPPVLSLQPSVQQVKEAPEYNQPDTKKKGEDES